MPLGPIVRFGLCLSRGYSSSSKSPELRSVCPRTGDVRSGGSGFLQGLLTRERFNLSAARSQLFLDAACASNFSCGPIGEVPGAGNHQALYVKRRAHHADTALYRSGLDRGTETSPVPFQPSWSSLKTGCRAIIDMRFGFGGIETAIFGYLADTHGIEHVFMRSSRLPSLGCRVACGP